MHPLYRACLIAAVSTAVCKSATAQEAVSAYPSKPVVLISAFAAGGPVDGEVRFYSERLQNLLGQPFVLDFKPGAGGTIGNAYVAKARPDGYTLLIASGSFSVYPAVYRDLPFDTINDFAPVSLMSNRTSVLVANPAFPAKTFSEYIAYARANPGKINYATTGSGGLGHLAGTWLHSATGTSVAFVHYKGAALQLLDLAAGRVHVGSGNLLAQMPLIKSGKIRPLAILTTKRSKLLPGTPSASEEIPEYSYTNWLGFVAPAATPPGIISKLGDAFGKLAKDPGLIARMDAEDISLVGSTPAQFRQHIISEVALWKRLVRENDVKLEQ